jgi:hypothetical protein
MHNVALHMHVLLFAQGVHDDLALQYTYAYVIHVLDALVQLTACSVARSHSAKQDALIQLTTCSD